MRIVDIRHITLPIASDMANAFILLSRHEAIDLVRYGGLRSDSDVLEMDSPLSDGFTEYQRTPAYLGENGCGGFADGDVVVDGYITLPDAPGIGLEAKSSLQPILDKLRS